MAQRKTLTEGQVEVLRWIADGCPAGDAEDDFRRISAAALRNRGLVVTSGRGRTWTAEITHAGRAYIADVDGPNPPLPRQANVSVTTQLLDEVIAAGGVLRVPRKRWDEPDGVDYERRARLAQRSGKVPVGKRLTASVVSRDEVELELVDAPAQTGARPELASIVVPDKVARYHETARQFRDRTDRHEVSRALLARATRLVHAVAMEAERRGWSGQASLEFKNGYGRSSWTGTKDGHIQIAAGSCSFWLRIQEEGVRTRGPWEEDVRRYRNVSSSSLLYRDRDVPTGPYDADANGRLKAELHSSQSWLFSGRQSRWADRSSWTLEERLPHLFREIEERVVEAAFAAEQERVEAEREADAARRAAEERERMWRVLMRQAEERLVESNCADQLLEQSNSWHRAEALRRYCDAMELAHGDRAETVAWLSWARTYIQQLDPLSEVPAMPANPEPTPEALQEHLPAGWSARGPEHRHT